MEGDTHVPSSSAQFQTTSIYLDSPPTNGVHSLAPDTVDEYHGTAHSYQLTWGIEAIQFSRC
jgi:hypothetical protein